MAVQLLGTRDRFVVGKSDQLGGGEDDADEKRGVSKFDDSLQLVDPSFHESKWLLLDSHGEEAEEERQVRAEDDKGYKQSPRS